MRRRRSPLAALWLAAAWALQLLAGAGAANPTWCIVRTGAPVRTVQAALDYACSPAGGADCAPIQPSALCYLPNTLAAHASYAFNSVYQRSHAAPGACDFAGTATVTLTDPSQYTLILSLFLPSLSRMRCALDRFFNYALVIF